MSMGELKLEIEPFGCLPCALGRFTINGQKANEDDFGCGRDFVEDISPIELGEFNEDLLDYGCINYYWVRDEKLKHDACLKYNISEADFDDICDKLEQRLYVGACGWCI